jgi:hypothetical protein
MALLRLAFGISTLQMVMVSHQNVPVNPHPETFRQLR